MERMSGHKNKIGGLEHWDNNKIENVNKTLEIYEHCDNSSSLSFQLDLESAQKHNFVDPWRSSMNDSGTISWAGFQEWVKRRKQLTNSIHSSLCFQMKNVITWLMLLTSFLLAHGGLYPQTVSQNKISFLWFLLLLGFLFCFVFFLVCLFGLR